MPPSYRLLSSVATAAILSFSTLVATAAIATENNQDTVVSGWDGETTNGYAYQLHTTKHVEIDQLGNYPPDTKRTPRVDRVMQGPKYTMMWRGKAPHDKQQVRSASFAQGDKKLGLFIPYWPAGSSASDTSGWSDIGGMPMHYSEFSLDVTRGKKDQQIAGEKAQHYILTAELTERGEDDTADTHIELHSNVWVLADKPFSFAPYSRPAIYADPRLQVAVAEQLGKLGMVVRTDTRYTRESIDDDGEVRGVPRSGTWVAWITDLKPAQAPVLNMPPLADRQTYLTLQKNFRQDVMGACKTILAGSKPAFIKDTLNADQRQSVQSYLHMSCQSRIVGWEVRDIRDNPKTMCKKIKSGWRPAVFDQGISEEMQQKYVDFANRYCNK